jgi:O-acetyl-ADP-ribose deacetylase (regulator of RNase III)
MLRMSGGVNGALLQRGGDSVAEELKQHLKKIGKTAVDRGTVVRTGPGPLKVKHILHAVGVDLFYETTVDIIRTLLETALTQAAELGARTVATPAIATGYGPLTIAEFATALSQVRREIFPGIEELRVVFRQQEQLDEVRRVLGGVSR